MKQKKTHGLDRFRGNGPYGKIPTKEEPIRTLGFTLPYNNRPYHGFRRHLDRLAKRSEIAVFVWNPIANSFFPKLNFTQFVNENVEILV